MTIRITLTHNEQAGPPAYVDVHYRGMDGSVLPTPTKTYTLTPGESRTLCVYSAQLLVVREGPDLPRAEGA